MTSLTMNRLTCSKVDHIVQSVEKWAEIWVYLRLQIAGQEAESLTSLNRGPGQDDSLGLSALEIASCGGDGEIGLACPGGADAKCQIMVQDRIKVLRWPGVFGLMARPLV